jgi:hypothetical protein
VEVLTPDHRARVVFRQWLLAKRVVNPQFVANVLFTGEMGFTGDCTVNFRGTHVWADDNPHTTMVSRHQHRFFLNICVGILGPVVLPNRLTGSSAPWVSLAYFPYLKKYAYEITVLCIYFYIHEPVFMKLGMYIMAPEPISLVYFIISSHQSVCLYVYTLFVVRQRFGKNVTAAKNTYAQQ